MIQFPELEVLPDEARLWLYAAGRPLTPIEAEAVFNRLHAFLSDWSSHGRAVRGAASLCENRILAIGAYIPSGDISGCGIDKSVHLLDGLAAELGFEWASGLMVAHRDAGGAIVLSSRPAFRAAVRSGDIGPDTHVIDLSPTQLASLREGRVECRAADTWHAAVFGIGAAVSAG